MAVSANKEIGLRLQSQGYQVIILGIVGDHSSRILGVVEEQAFFRQSSGEAFHFFRGDVVLAPYTQ